MVCDSNCHTILLMIGLTTRTNCFNILWRLHSSVLQEQAVLWESRQKWQRPACHLWKLPSLSAVNWQVSFVPVWSPLCYAEAGKEPPDCTSSLKAATSQWRELPFHSLGSRWYCLWQPARTQDIHVKNKRPSEFLEVHLAHVPEEHR